jgi:hypothetical protein
MLKTLVLGHGNYYKKENIRCSPIPVDEWFNDPYISLDDIAEINPDILYHIDNKRWTFAKDSSYDRIIDCTGGSLMYGGFNSIHFHEDNLNTVFFKEIQRILRPYGLFYANKRTGWVFQKNGEGELVLLKKKEYVEFLRPPASEERIETIKEYIFVKSGAYTVDEVVELEDLREKYEKELKKFMKYWCGICNTKMTDLETHNKHLQTDDHKIKRCFFIKKLKNMDLYQLRNEYDTVNINRIIRDEETTSLCL